MTKTERDRKVSKEQLLLEAARLGRLAALESVLGQISLLKSKKRANPLASLRKTLSPNNIRDPVTGFTCLHHAALNGHADCVELILNHGAKPNSVDYKGSSALHLAAWAGNLDVVQVLLNHSATATAANSDTITAQSSSANNTQQSSSDALKQNQIASKTNSQRAVSRSPTNSALSSSSSPPPTSSSSSSQQQYQFRHPIDIDLCNNDNQTPLSLAAQFGHTQVVNELLKHGANVHLRNSQLESPLDLACLNGRHDTVNLLLKFSPKLVDELRRQKSVICLPSKELEVLAGNRNCPLTSTTGSRHPTPHKLHASSSSPARSSVASPPQSQGYQRNSSASGWASLLKGKSPQSSPSKGITPSQLSSDQIELERGSSVRQRRATLSVASAASTKQSFYQSIRMQRASKTIDSGQDSSSDDHHDPLAVFQLVEKLLDHSPLHYAVRRGHSSVVQLLLYSYEANILQITTFGGVLHEIALNNGKHSDMVAILFKYLSDRYALDDSKRISILQEFLQLKDSFDRSVFDVLNDINNKSAQEIKRMIYDYSDQLEKQTPPAITPQLYKTGNENPTNRETFVGLQQQHHHHHHNQQQQQNYASQPQQVQSKQFSDIQHMNSFVTMKRVPKNQISKQERRNEAPQLVQMRPLGEIANYVPHQSHNMQQLMPGSSQTVDTRRGRMSRFAGVSLQSSLINGSGFAQDSRSGESQQQQQQQQLQLAYQMFQMPMMTRSVSNLAGNQTTSGQQIFHAGSAEQSALANGDGIFLITNYQNQHQQLRNANFVRMNPDDYDNNLCSPSMMSNQSQGHLVRSQTDCSHLVNRYYETPDDRNQQLNGHSADLLIRQSSQRRALEAKQRANLQHFATLDRKSINRHYHVYDHEFYPPRLIVQPHTTGGSEQVTRLAHLGNINYQHNQNRHQQTHCTTKPEANESGFGAMRSSVRSNHSGQVPNFGGQQHGSIFTPTQLPTPESGQFVTNSDQVERQQQMDRFLSHRSRAKPQLVGQSSLSGYNPRLPTSDSNSSVRREDLLELQRKLIMDANQNQFGRGPNPQSLEKEPQQPLGHSSRMQTSQSFESHLSEPHLLFETTRRALMRDFDQMIGRELLSQNKAQIRGVPRAHEAVSMGQTGNVALPGQQQYLTGVSLNMDSCGERLFVSGTCVTIPDDQQSSSSSLATPASSQTSHLGSRALGTGRTSQEAPAKPPRLSLMHKQKLATACREQSQHVSDMHPNELTRQLAESRQLPQADNDLTTSEANQQSKQVARPPRAVPLTKPPQMRPPAPPSCPQVGHRVTSGKRSSLASPLQVLPSGEQQLVCGSNNSILSYKSSSNSSAGSASLSGSSVSANATATRQTGGLLKMAAPQVGRSAAGNQDGCSTKLMHHLNQQHQQHSSELDSGICTSNSPASISHDSEGPSNDNSIRQRQQKQPQACPSQEMSVTSQQYGGKNHRATIKQTARVGIQPNNKSSISQQHMMGSKTDQEADHSDREEPDAPPSPKTAQLCIEEALMPLSSFEPTDRHVSNSHRLESLRAKHLQASTRRSNFGSIDCRLNEFDGISFANRSPSEQDYENCVALQQQLKRARGFRSMSNLLLASCDKAAQAEQYVVPNSNLSRLEAMSPVSFAISSSLENDEDDDYAESPTILTDCEAGSSALSSLAPTSPDEAPPSPKVTDKVTEGQAKTISSSVAANDRSVRASDDSIHSTTPAIEAIEIKRASQVDAETLTDGPGDNPCCIQSTVRKRKSDQYSENSRVQQPSESKLVDMTTQTITDQSEAGDSLKEGNNELIESCSPQRENFNQNSNKQISEHSLNLKNCFGNNIDRNHDPKSKGGQASDDLHQKPLLISNQANSANKFVHRPESALRMKQWFSSSLASYTPYLSKFFAHGFDNLEFLNHDELMNDQLLITIGVDMELHRRTIQQVITRELPQTNFCKLFDSLRIREQNSINEFALYQILQIDHAISRKDKNRNIKLNAVDLNSLRSEYDQSSKSASLPVGYRTRLAAALDYLVTSAEQNNSRGAIKDEGENKIHSYEVENDTSHTSERSSSSSSKTSVKSIVSRPQTGEENLVPQNTSASSSPKQDFEEQIMEVKKSQRRLSDVITLTKTHDDRADESGRKSVKQFTRAGLGRSSLSGSLVSEVARKLEAAVAQQQPKVALRPVAAARRTVATRNQQSKASAPQDPQPIQNETRTNPGPNRATFVSVKSVCWPPQQTNTSNNNNNNIAQTIELSRGWEKSPQGSVTSTDEQSDGNNNNNKESDTNFAQRGLRQVESQNRAPTRPKPPPPVKPAKLVENHLLNMNQ